MTSTISLRTVVGGLGWSEGGGGWADDIVMVT